MKIILLVILHYLLYYAYKIIGYISNFKIYLGKKYIENNNTLINNNFDLSRIRPYNSYPYKNK
jgi:hypothetical protein